MCVCAWEHGRARNQQPENRNKKFLKIAKFLKAFLNC